MNESHQHDAEKEPQAPPKLIAALKKIPREPVFVPPHIDNAVLRAAREQLEGRVSRRSILRPWILWPGFVTACIVVAGIFLTRRDFAREDVNHDGRVDIVDSLALVRRVAEGKIEGTKLDFNHDGKVDARDAETIAVQVVKLEKGNRS